MGRINITSSDSPEDYELLGGLIGAGLFEVTEATGMNGKSNPENRHDVKSAQAYASMPQHDVDSKDRISAVG